ncbi:hypothetical protein B9Z55_005114 [Caenorhabditis nigoni]|uniref:Uncharacterized protein n=1 Tax=Caenorhabditis nigoni TaxID=1611254 RepID=A0A2G5UZI3_9PELO|nr:hypothetical protein B9Z55_005114 [Caenorhabditis nigoni]
MAKMMTNTYINTQTWDSQAVSDPSTNWTQRCLTCQIGRMACIQRRTNLVPQTWVIKPPLNARLPSSPLPAADAIEARVGHYATVYYLRFGTTLRPPTSNLGITIQMYKIEYKNQKAYNIQDSQAVSDPRITIQMYKIEYKKSKSLQHPGFPGRLRSKY